MAEHGDNLLVTNFDRYYECGNEFVAVIRIKERYSYSPIEGGYNKTVLAQGNRDRVREKVAEAFDYAREHGLKVQVNNPHVREDIDAGNYNVAGLLIVDEIQNTICDNRTRTT